LSSDPVLITGSSIRSLGHRWLLFWWDSAISGQS